MKLVVFSDAHGDATTAGLDRFEDVEGAIAEVVDGARRERADAALFLGDLTDPDTSRSHRAVAMLAKAATDLRRGGIEFAALVGNHDVVEDGSGASTLSPLAGAGFRVCSEPTIAPIYGRHGGPDVSLVALPYPPRSRTFDPEAFVREEGARLVSSMRREPIVVAGHLMIRGADPGSESAELARGRDVFFPVEACREIFGPNVLMLGGHYHRRQVINGVHIPGSLVRLRFDEERHEPGYLIVEL